MCASMFEDIQRMYHFYFQHSRLCQDEKLPRGTVQPKRQQRIPAASGCPRGDRACWPSGKVRGQKYLAIACCRRSSAEQDLMGPK